MKRSEILGLLPEVIQRTTEDGSPLDALLTVMEELHAPTESVLGELDALFDPMRTREALVPMLGRWVGLDGTFAVDLEQARAFIAEAASLWRWRGTAVGIVRALELATASRGFEVVEAAADGRARAFHMTVVVPKRLDARRELLERLIELQKPAYVTYELIFTERTS